VEIYQGNSLGTLTSVPISSQLIGNMRQVVHSRRGTPDCRRGRSGYGRGVDTSFAQRTSPETD
jgi:hypothetical protein